MRPFRCGAGSTSIGLFSAVCLAVPLTALLVFLRLSPRHGDLAERHAERRRFRFRQLSAHLQHAELLARHNQLSGDERLHDIARAGLRACRRLRDLPLPGARPRASARRRLAAVAGALARAGIGIDLPARAQRHRHEVHRPRHQHLWLLGIAHRQRALRAASGGSHHRRGPARGRCAHLRGRRNAGNAGAPAVPRHHASEHQVRSSERRLHRVHGDDHRFRQCGRPSAAITRSWRPKSTARWSAR